MLPDAWAYRRVADFPHPTDQTVQTGPFGAQLHADDYADEGVPFVLIRNIRNGRVDSTGMPRITFADAARLGNYALQEGDIVFSRVGRVGSCFLTEADHAGWIISGQLLRMRLDMAEMDPRFLIHWIGSPYIERHMLGESVGTTRQSINSSILANMPLPVVPKSEQSKIAEILDTLDTTIRQTEAIIEKLRRVKQGLLHDLLTRGIDANGELRPPPGQAPHLYKDSPLGRIARDWDVELLDDVALRGSGHTPSKSVASYWNGGVQWVSLADSHRLDQIYIDATDKEISDLGIANSSAVKHPEGTVILSRDAGVGKSAVLASEMAVSQHFMAWQCSHRLSNLFLYFKLQHMKPTFESIALGSTVKTIGLDYFRKLRVSVPARPEQDRAVEVLMAAELDIRKQQAHLSKLGLLRSGLMNDLLTGRVRVTPLLA